MDRTETGFTEAYAQSLSADYDLDLRPSHVAFVRDKLSCHDNYLCQIILNPTMQGEVMGQIRFRNTRTKTCTHREGKLYMSFRHFMAGNKKMIYILSKKYEQKKGCLQKTKLKNAIPYTGTMEANKHGATTIDNIK